MAAAAIVPLLPVIANVAILSAGVISAFIPIIQDGYTIYVNSKSGKIEKVIEPSGAELTAVGDKLVDDNGVLVEPHSDRFTRILEAAKKLTSSEMIDKIKSTVGQVVSHIKDIRSQVKYVKGSDESQDGQAEVIEVDEVAIDAEPHLAMVGLERAGSLVRGGCEGLGYCRGSMMIGIICALLVVLILFLRLPLGASIVIVSATAVLGVGGMLTLNYLKPECKCDKSTQ